MSTSRGQIHGRDEFIARIAGKLGRTGRTDHKPVHEARGVPSFYKERSSDKQQRIAQFAGNWESLGGHLLVTNEQDAPREIAEYISGLCSSLSISRAVRWEHEQLAALGIDAMMGHAGVQVVPWGEMEAGAFTGSEPLHRNSRSNWMKRSALLQSAERCELGIVWPEFAIANTGTLVVCSNAKQGKSVSLVADALLAIFRADQLVVRMGEAFTAIRADHSGAEDMPSSIHLITGPSRSADIENDLTIGVHGPGKVYAVIID